MWHLFGAVSVLVTIVEDGNYAAMYGLFDLPPTIFTFFRKYCYFRA